MECHDCNKPLGHDSIELGYDLCHDCRKCTACDLSVGPRDIKFCRSLNLPYVKHPRCVLLDPSVKSNPETIVTILNWCSSMENTQTFIKDMSFDQQSLFLQSVQNVAANMSILLRKDKKLYEDMLKEKQVAEAEKKPKKKDPIQEAKKVGITTTSEKVARKKLSMREKGIEEFMKLGLDRAAATSMYEMGLAKAQERQNRLN